MIQAKPLSFKTDEEVLRDNLRKLGTNLDNMESYLEAVKQEAFKEEDIILIEPDIDIKQKFEEIDLLCNTEYRLNNTVNAAIRPPGTYERLPKSNNKVQRPTSTKNYDTDTEGEEAKHPPTKENLDFNNILKKCGVKDLNKLIGLSSEDEQAKAKQNSKP